MANKGKYRKGNEIVEAVQFVCGSEVPAMDFLGLDDTTWKRPMYYENDYATCEIFQPEVSNLAIKTPRGFVSLKNWDYVVRDASGQFYPCDCLEFERTYKYVITEVEVFENERNYSVIVAPTQKIVEKLGHLGYTDYCQVCNREHEPFYYYVPERDKWMCEDCYKEWANRQSRKEEVSYVETRNLNNMKRLLNI